METITMRVLINNEWALIEVPLIEIPWDLIALRLHDQLLKIEGEEVSE